MKKLMVLLAMLLMLVACASESEARDNDIKEYYLFRDVTIIASGTSTGEYSTGIDLDKAGIKGIFALSIDVDTDGAAGVVKFELELSDDRTNWVEPTGVSDIVTGFSETSGPGTDGIDVYPIDFAGHIQKYARIKCTETGGAASITLEEVKLTIQ